jgi:Kelch motif
VVIPKPIRSMVKARGCFSACFLYDFVYAVGGVNIIEGVLTACERYDTHKDTWQEISDMNVPRKNSSLCALTADSMYVFGGTTPDDHMTDIIEQYLVSANIWVSLPVRMPYNMSFLSTFKVSPFQILILGGIVEGASEITKESFITN